MDASGLNELANRLFASFEQHDHDAVASMMADDATLTQNGTTSTWDEFRPRLEAIRGWLGDHRYNEVRRVFGSDVVVEEHHVVATTPDGRAVNLAACVVVRVDERGLITSLDEYVDPSSVAG